MKLEVFDYFLLIFFIFFSFGISVLILKLHYFLTPQVNSLDKMVGYECGYDPFGDARSNFNVQFYLVGILFLIFDLEIAFLFPWSVSAFAIPFFSFLVIYFFLILLSIGFIFEYKKGALYW